VFLRGGFALHDTNGNRQTTRRIDPFEGAFVREIVTQTERSPSTKGWLVHEVGDRGGLARRGGPNLEDTSSSLQLEIGAERCHQCRDFCQQHRLEVRQLAIVER
jgi:hypothetical protein